MTTVEKMLSQRPKNFALCYKDKKGKITLHLITGLIGMDEAKHSFLTYSRHKGVRRFNVDGILDCAELD